MLMCQCHELAWLKAPSSMDNGELKQHAPVVVYITVHLGSAVVQLVDVGVHGCLETDLFIDHLRKQLQGFQCASAAICAQAQDNCDTCGSCSRQVAGYSPSRSA